MTHEGGAPRVLTGLKSIAAHFGVTVYELRVFMRLGLPVRVRRRRGRSNGARYWGWRAHLERWFSR